MLAPTHTQCKLRKGSTNLVSWIPTKFAQEGRALKLDNENGVREEGWEVEWVGTTLPTSVVMQRERDFKSHRKATDV